MDSAPLSPTFAAAAISTHPIPAMATGEVIGALLESIGQFPDLVLLFASVHHTGPLEDTAGAILATLQPATLAGCTAPMVFANSTDSGRGPGLAVWAGNVGHVDARWAGDLKAGAHELSEGDEEQRLSRLWFVDSFSEQVNTLPTARRANSGNTGHVLGATVSAGNIPGANRLVLQDRIENHGSISLTFRGASIQATASHGARAIGEPVTVTQAENFVVRNLAFAEPKAILTRALSELRDYEHDKRADVLLGVVADEHGVFFDAPHHVAKVLGVDNRTGALSVSHDFGVGAVVQFFIRTPTSAKQDLSDRLIDNVAPSPVLGCVSFTDRLRSADYFSEPHCDATAIQTVCNAPTAGMTSNMPFSSDGAGPATPSHVASGLFRLRENH